MEFLLNKSTYTIQVKREFAAPVDMVWAAWTQPELLDQWWAPKPYRSQTKHMEFSVGGKRVYAMCSPEGEKFWAMACFTAISPKTNFQYWDAFCDEHGKANEEKPRSDWSITFVGVGDMTQVEMTIAHHTLADLEKLVALGFKQGFAIALDGLDDLLRRLHQ